MQERVRQIRGHKKTLLLMFSAMLIYRLCLDLNYACILAGVGTQYPRIDLNLFRYATSLGWNIILFLGIRHQENRASSFLLYLIFLLQIIPISSIYGLCDMEGDMYYHILCMAFLLCELLVGIAPVKKHFQQNAFVSNVMLSGFALAIPLVLIVVFWSNGLPSLTALNIYKVYELRGSGAFQLNKYMNYLLGWTTRFFIPLFLSLCIYRKKYWTAVLLIAAQFVIYLYTGAKGYLFSIPMIVACVLWGQRKNCYKELFLCLCGGFSLLSLLSVLASYTGVFPKLLEKLVLEINSLLCRRMMFIPAINKFVYYDYFTEHPKLGIYGIFPTWLVNVESYYADIPYTYEISAIYYNLPEMNSNTGFFAEGYARFGHLGTFIVLIVLAFLLRQADNLQRRLGYAATIGIFVYSVFTLADGFLLDELLFGYWLLILLFVFFYKTNDKRLLSKRIVSRR